MTLLKKLFMLVLLVLASIGATAQVKLQGKITDKQGANVEFATVCVDSTVIIADADGNFEMEIPKGHTEDLKISHLSFRTAIIPFAQYKSGRVTVELEENITNLANVNITANKAKKKTIAHKGIKIPGDVAFHNVAYMKYEIGPIINCKSDYIAKSLRFKVEECTFTHCTVRFIIYEVNESKFTPIQHKPIYIQFDDKHQNMEHVVKINEEIFMKAKHKYYIGVAVVSSNGKGEIHFPAYMHKGFVRNFGSGKIKKLPATLGVTIDGLSCN